MVQQAHETAVDFLRRVVNTISSENEFVLDTLPTASSVFDYVKLLDDYKSSDLIDIGAAIQHGEDPAGYHKFLDTHNLQWRRHFSPIAKNS